MQIVIGRLCGIVEWCLSGIDSIAVTQRKVIVSFEAGGQIDQGCRCRIVSIVASSGKTRGRHEGAISLPGKCINRVRVVIQRITVRALVTNVFHTSRETSFQVVWHVRPAHRAGGIHQQHDVRLGLRRVVTGKRHIGNIRRTGQCNTEVGSQKQGNRTKDCTFEIGRFAGFRC